MSRTIIAVVSDMFFASKIRATAEALGVNIKFPRTLEILMSSAEEATPAMIVVDLHNEKLNPIDVATQLKTNESLKAIPLLGFFSHVETELQRKALAAGYDQVLPRSVFSRDLAEILRQEK
jgi:CheY-like chemotaxis protein